MRILIIISMFLVIFGSAGYYVYERALQAFPGQLISSTPVLILYILLISSFLMGKIIERFSLGFVSNTLVKIGSYGMGLFLYAFLFVVLFDLLRLIYSIAVFWPGINIEDYQKAKLIAGLFTVIAITTIFITGYIKARKPKVKTLDITINKSRNGFDSLNIVAVSDIHLGTMVNKSKTERLINSINNLKPDLVIIAGDIIDDNMDVVKHYKLLEYFQGIKAKYGVYSCLGNHEYISSAFKNLDYFTQNGIHMLKDSAVKVDNKFYIIGRDDIESKKRKSLAGLTGDIDFDLPVIILDHQPYKLGEVAEYAVDLQFSGHTHNGQVWPFNYITGLIFEEDWGYLKKKNTHYYISSGYGTAVMPIRVGNNSEIVNIKITNK